MGHAAPQFQKATRSRALRSIGESPDGFANTCDICSGQGNCRFWFSLRVRLFAWPAPCGVWRLEFHKRRPGFESRLAVSPRRVGVSIDFFYVAEDGSAANQHRLYLPERKPGTVVVYKQRPFTFPFPISPEEEAAIKKWQMSASRG